MNLDPELLMRLREEQLDLRNEDFSRYAYKKGNRYAPDMYVGQDNKIYKNDLNLIKQDRYNNINLKKLLSEDNNIENMDYMGSGLVGGARIGGELDFLYDDDEFGGAAQRLTKKVLKENWKMRKGNYVGFEAYYKRLVEKRKQKAKKPAKKAAKKAVKKMATPAQIRKLEEKLAKLVERLKTHRVGTKVRDNVARMIKKNEERLRKYKASRKGMKGGNMIYDFDEVDRFDFHDYL